MDTCPACSAPLNRGRLLCPHCGYATRTLASVDDELRALEELGSFARQLAIDNADDEFDRREAIGALMSTAFVPETVPAIKRAFLETVQNIQPSHLDDDAGNTLLRNRCDILLTKLRMDHPSETAAIRELQRVLDRRLAEWNADVQSEQKATRWILIAGGIMAIGGLLLACCGGVANFG